MITPFLISPKGEKVVSLLPPWGRVGKGVLIGYGILKIHIIKKRGCMISLQPLWY